MKRDRQKDSVQIGQANQAAGVAQNPLAKVMLATHCFSLIDCLAQLINVLFVIANLFKILLHLKFANVNLFFY